MLIYAQQITPRLQYIAEIFFGECLLTDSAVEFFEASCIKINYSHKRFGDEEFHLVPHGLLNERILQQHVTNVFNWNALPVFFPVKGDIPFDIFAASFYLLSRYEEYLPHKKDSYGRFSHTDSIAFREGFLGIPLVNLWMQQLYLLLRIKFPAFKEPVRKFRFIPTYDVDIAFAEGGFVRNLVNTIKRRQTKINGRDAFDVYEWLNGLHHDYHLSAIYFFLLAKYRGKYDRNISRTSKRLQQLVKATAAATETGIHPSWESFHDDNALMDEIGYLRNITRKSIAVSRQHYIKFTLPQTYRELITAGISHDYSMGYGSTNGFRASFAAPFYWYDLMKEEKTSLLLHPFCFMEANSFFEQNFSAEQAATELQAYHDAVKKVNGELITIFHNHFLTEAQQWQPWRKMYAEFIARNFKQETITSPSQQEL